MVAGKRGAHAAWAAAGVVLLGCLAGLQLGVVRRGAQRTALQERVPGGQQLRLRRRTQLAQLSTPAAASAAAAALRREVEQKGGARSPAMGVLQHVVRDLSGRRAGGSSCDCQQLASVGQSLGSRNAAQAACGCPRVRPIPPPRLINGDDCADLDEDAGAETRGVRWLVDCPSKWVPARRPAPPPAKPEEEEDTYSVGPEVGQTYADALEAPPGEEEPEIEKDVMGPHPDIFAPQEPWHALKDYRNEWYYDYEAAPYTAQYDDESEHDQFSPEEPWNDRPSAIVLDATFADLQSACVQAGEDHVWNAEAHECLYQGQASWPEMPRGQGVTQEGPGRKAMDGETPLGDVIDDAKELDEFGARRPEPAGEVDQFGWRPAAPVRPRDTTLDYQTVDLERACRAQMQTPVKGRAYSWDPAQGKCLYLGRPARAEAQPPQTTHPLTDGIYADLKRDCLTRGGEWQYPRVDGQPGVCDESARRR